MTETFRSLIGVGILVLIGFLLSYNRKAINWRTVLAALAVQMAIGAFVLFVPVGKDILGGIAGGVTHVLEYGFKGTEFLFGGLVSGTWIGALTGLVWGGLVRILIVHHVTWSVNSVCHLWGRRPFPCDDHSRDNFLFGVLAFGEGWHNSHHAFPTSARHGLRWWQIDVTYWVIRGMALVGLAWNLKLPSPQAQLAARSR